MQLHQVADTTKRCRLMRSSMIMLWWHLMRNSTWRLKRKKIDLGPEWTLVQQGFTPLLILQCEEDERQTLRKERCYNSVEEYAIPCNSSDSYICPLCTAWIRNRVAHGNLYVSPLDRNKERGVVLSMVLNMCQWMHYRTACQCWSGLGGGGSLSLATK